MATGADLIDLITIQEFGDIDLSGIGTSATQVLITLAGTLTVLETVSGGACVGPSCEIAVGGHRGRRDLLG